MKKQNTTKTYLANNPELKAMRTPHIRTVKAEFFMHEEVAEMSPLARLAWIGLWTQCDKHGRFIWRPKTLKIQILPFDAVEFDLLLSEMQDHGFIQRYEVDGQSYGQVTNWMRHQGINARERDSLFSYPAPTSKPLSASETSAPCKHMPARAGSVHAPAMSVGVGVGVGVELELGMEVEAKGTASAVLSSEAANLKPESTEPESKRQFTNRKTDGTASRIKEFLKSWAILYRQTYVTEPTISYPKELKRLQPIFEQNESNTILSAAQAFLAEKTDFTTGHELGIFISQFNRWRTIGQRETGNGLANSGKFAGLPIN